MISLNAISLAAADVAKLLKEVGVAGDKESIDTMISKLDEKDLTELINSGYEKFAGVGGVGGAAADGSAPGGVLTDDEVEKE